MIIDKINFSTLTYSSNKIFYSRFGTTECYNFILYSFFLNLSKKIYILLDTIMLVKTIIHNLQQN